VNRRAIAFACGDATLIGTLDGAPGATGLLVVSGGNDVRAGAWAGQAQLAARIAAAGYPVLRFDRRGVGDSEGPNRGFGQSRDDIAAALAAFRAEAPHLERVVAFGNCDAASALMRFAAGLPIDALVLANPWSLEDDGEGAQDPAALRARYARKLTDPAELKRLLGGKVDLAKLARGLRQAAQPARRSGLAEEMREGLARFADATAILIATGDRTAQLFLAAWDSADPRIARCDTASHSFADGGAREWLFAQVLAALAEK
jgi:exosortase A-associated hydrolase 1